MSHWGYRICAGCGNDLHGNAYSRRQWSFPVGRSRCRLCVSEGVDSDQSGFGTARTNNATRVMINRYDLIGEGTFRYCYSGRYLGGQRTGQECVGKEFKENWMNDAYMDRDLNAVDKALKIIMSWNRAGFCSTVIRLNVPEKWTIDGCQYLVEPFIDDFFKINSNNGWTTDIDDNKVDMLQALSHYSYHVTSGQFVLCDLQGGIFRNGIILTDPCILSRNSRFGSSDLGPAGISSFFYHHECNHYCKRNWTQPRDQRPVYRPVPHTTMSFGHRADDSDSESDSDYY
jgi:hypothetical protein